MGSTLIPPTADDKLAQRHRSLREANRVRQARAALLGRMAQAPIAESCQMAADIAWDPPEVLRSMPVYDFLLRVRGVREVGATRLLEACQIPEMTSLGTLTMRQRSALESVLRSRG